jgi:hypothetical protein
VYVCVCVCVCVGSICPHVSREGSRSPGPLHPAPQSSLPLLEDVLLLGNPVEEKGTADGTWIADMTKKFSSLKRLDGKPVIRADAIGDDAGGEGKEAA